MWFLISSLSKFELWIYAVKVIKAPIVHYTVQRKKNDLVSVRFFSPHPLSLTQTLHTIQVKQRFN